MKIYLTTQPNLFYSKPRILVETNRCFFIQLLPEFAYVMIQNTLKFTYAMKQKRVKIAYAMKQKNI